jgi:hypothetical protein
MRARTVFEFGHCVLEAGHMLLDRPLSLLIGDAAVDNLGIMARLVIKLHVGLSELLDLVRELLVLERLGINVERELPNRCLELLKRDHLLVSPFLYSLHQSPRGVGGEGESAFVVGAPFQPGRGRS